MGAIKDIVDLAIELESRAKDRKDIETLRSIISLTHSLQASQAEIVERDLRVMQENAQAQREIADLKRQLAEAQAEEVRVYRAVEFRRGRRTSDKWAPFCPRCHMPASLYEGDGYPVCSDRACEWSSDITRREIEQFIRQL